MICQQREQQRQLAYFLFVRKDICIFIENNKNMNVNKENINF